MTDYIFVWVSIMLALVCGYCLVEIMAIREVLRLHFEFMENTNKLAEETAKVLGNFEKYIQVPRESVSGISLRTDSPSDSVSIVTEDKKSE